MARIALALSFLLLLSGCASQSSLVIQPYSELAIEVPEKMFSSVKMRDGELGVNGDGEFNFPDFVLRFVDSDWNHESLNPESIPESDAETMTYYQF